MKIALHDSDNTNFPNLALMKLSAAYKEKGHIVSWYSPSVLADKIISSKVFTFTKEADLPPGTVKGGGGYGQINTLPDSVEHTCPDYTLYGLNYSLGFLTRGCPRKCAHCFVPKREGTIRPHADIEEFTRHKSVVLMDNNVLACDHGQDQLRKISTLGIKVDFNQGLDARLIDDTAARTLAGIKWLRPIRLACDSYSQMNSVQSAVTLLRWHNAPPSRYFCYVLINDVEDAQERIKFLKGLYLDAFAQPYMDAAGTPPSIAQRQLARWCNTKKLYMSCSFEDYREGRGPSRV